MKVWLEIEYLDSHVLRVQELDELPNTDLDNPSSDDELNDSVVEDHIYLEFRICSDN